jgi:hypothetical protein
VTVQTLTPVPFVPDGPGLDITAQLAAPTQTTLQFANSGREVLLVAAGAVSETVTVDIGTKVLGQAVTNFSSVSLTNAHTVAFGPFHSAAEQPGGDMIQVTLSTVTAITIVLLQLPGVF